MEHNSTILDGVEVDLTPAQWGIRAADELRKRSSLADWQREEVAWLDRVLPLMQRQSESAYPGDQGKQREAKAEFVLRSQLLCGFVGVNGEVERRVERAGPEAALLCTLNTLAEIAHSTYLPKAGEWSAQAEGLICNLYAYRAAVGSIQDRYFEGHEILAVDVEAGLTNAIELMKQAVLQYNQRVDADDEQKDQSRIYLDRLEPVEGDVVLLTDCWIGRAQAMTDFCMRLSRRG